jgi:hypothetical protein
MGDGSTGNGVCLSHVSTPNAVRNAQLGDSSRITITSRRYATGGVASAAACRPKQISCFTIISCLQVGARTTHYGFIPQRSERLAVTEMQRLTSDRSCHVDDAVSRKPGAKSRKDSAYRPASL